MGEVVALASARPTRALTPHEIAAVIRLVRADLTSERAAQDALAAPLERLAAFTGAAYEREARLDALDRPDFLVGGVVVEIKTRGWGKRAVYRQLERYAAHACVTGLVLATNMAMALPTEIVGKPALLVSLGRAWL